MKQIGERETPSQNIAFLGIMSGVCVILSLISSFVPVLTIISIFVLPIASSLGTRLTKTKYSIPFLLATSALMIAVSAFNITETIFYLIPSVLCGGLYGLLAKKKAPSTYLIMAVSFLSLGLNYLSIPISKAITGLNPIETTLTLLGLIKRENALVAFPAILLALGLIQTVLEHFLIVFLHGRLEIEEGKTSFLLDGIASLFFGFISISLGLFVLEIGYMALTMGAFFFICSIYDVIVMKNKTLYILFVVFLIIGVFLVAFVSPLLINKKAIMLGGYYPFISGLLIILFSMKKNESIAKY